MNNEQIAPMSSIKPKINPARSYVSQSSEHAQKILLQLLGLKAPVFWLQEWESQGCGPGYSYKAASKQHINSGCALCLATQSCPPGCDSVAPLSLGFSRQEYWRVLTCSPPGESSQPRDWTQVSRSAGGLLTDWATREATSALEMFKHSDPAWFWVVTEASTGYKRWP